MKETMYQDATPDERLRMLEANCDLSQDDLQRRPYTKDEVETFEHALADNSVTILTANEHLAEAKKAHKEQTAEPKAAVKQLTKDLKRGYEVVRGKIYGFIDTEAGKMIFFDESGEEVSRRKLFPGERQPSIHSINKTA